MKVGKVIELLKGYDPKDEIICAWWDEDLAPVDIDDVPWEDQVEIVDYKMDWSAIHEDMGFLIDTNFKEEEE